MKKHFHLLIQVSCTSHFCISCPKHCGHIKDHYADTSLWLPAAKQFLQCCIVFSSLTWIVCKWFVRAKLWLCIFKHKRATYQLSMSKYSSSQYSKWGKGENMWWLINNTPSFTSATLKIIYADTSLWLPAAKQFPQCCIVLSSLSCVSDFVKTKLWLCTFKHKRATYVLSVSKPSSHSTASGKKEKTWLSNNTPRFILA